MSLHKEDGEPKSPARGQNHWMVKAAEWIGHHQSGGLQGQLPTMAEREKRLLLLEQRNQTLMEKIRSLQKANANLRKLNTRLREENEVFKSTEEILLRDNDKIRKKVHQLKELQESLQDDIYVLEEQLCACTCREDKRDEPLEALNPVEPFSL